MSLIDTTLKGGKMKRFACLAVALLAVASISPARQSGPLRVMVSAPRGPLVSIDQASTIIATFDQPMTALQAVPQDEASGPLFLQPPVPGKYRWLSTTTISFTPAHTLPMATAFAVIIPSGTRSLSGAALGGDFVWTFETPRPRVIRAWPTNAQKSVEQDHVIQLRFNQPVQIGKVQEMHLWEQTKTKNPQIAVPFTLEHPADSVEGDRMAYLVIRPQRPFALGAHVMLDCDGVKGLQGTLGMNEPYHLAFSVVEVFRFYNLLNVEPFNPNDALRLAFSNPVLRREVATHLRIEPPPTKPPETDLEYDYPSSEVVVPVGLEPERSYTGMILPGIKDMFGQVLNDTVRFKFRTGPFPSIVSVTTGQGILEAYAAHKVPVTFTNIDSVRLQLGRIDPNRIVTLMQRMDYSNSQRLMWEEAVLDWVDSRSEEKSQFSVNRLWYPQAPRNTRVVRPIDLDEVLGKSQRGIVLVQVDNLAPKPEKRRYLKTLVQVTDMGITSKFSPENTLVWVTNLKDATPVPNAHVEIRSDSNLVLWSGSTDATGLAKAPGWGRLGLQTPHEEESEYEGEWYGSNPPRQWIIVRNGGDVAFSSSDWNTGIEPYVFNVEYDWSPQLEPVEASLFTDRGLYKAGEEVELKGIIRVRSGGEWRVPGRTAVALKVRDARGEETSIAVPQLNAFGSFAVSIPLKAAAPAGNYLVNLSTVPALSRTAGKPARARHVTSASFRVEAFRPAEFEVSAALPGTNVIIGDTLEGRCTARYLFGSPLKNASVHWRLSASRSSWQPEGYEGYTFTALDWLSRSTRYGYRLLSNRDTVLDDMGGLAVRIPLPVGTLVGPQTLMLEADVTSPTRQVIAGRATLRVLGGEFAIGIASSTSFLQRDSLLSCRIIALDPDRNQVSGQSLDLRICQRIWRSVRKAETGGRYHWESIVDDVLKDSAKIVTEAVPLVRTFRPKEAGFYYMTVSGTDRRGNPVSTDTYFYVSGASYVAWERRDDDRIELVTDKTNYKPGDVAHVMVKSPYEKAPALISIEREGVLSQYTAALTGSAPQIDVPILHEYLPNVFISVVLIQGRVEGVAATRETDIGRPSFKIGYATLPVSPEERHLRVEVRTDRKEYRPGDSVAVTIQTATSAGSPARAEVALSVADLGVLNLIGYRMPDPFHLFYHPRGLAVTTTESRIHLIQQRNYDEKGEEPGGGGLSAAEQGGFDAEGIRKDFRPSAYWNPSILTDESGRATIRFKLPDNLTAFNVMAVVNTQGSEFGCGETDLRVNKPLLLQPSMPRFVRVGDRFEPGVVVMNTTQKAKRVRVLTRAEGVLFQGKDTVEFTLPAGQSREIHHRAEAQRVGTAVFTFRALSEDDRDGLQWRIPVQVSRQRETVALYESLNDTQTQEKVAIPTDVYRDAGGLEFTAASTALVGLGGGISYLFEYPYGCLEQRLSRVLPMIVAKDLVEAFKFEVLKGKDYRDVVNRMLEEIPLFQRYDGGFAYWKNVEGTSPYVSALAAYTLVRAQQNGYAISPRVLDEALRYCRDVLTGRRTDQLFSRHESFCTNSLILYTLALTGKPDFGYMERLFNLRKEMPLFAQAYLLRALATAKGNRTMIDELVRTFTNRVKVAPTSAHFEEAENVRMPWVFHSNTRTTALILQALVETQSEQPLIPKVVRWLTDAQRNGCWRTTQENLYVVDALTTYFKAYEKDAPEFRAEIKLAGGSALKEMFYGRTMTTAKAIVPMADLQAGVSYPVDIMREGRGRLYYGIRMSYIPKGEAKPRDEGLTITREVEGAARDSSGVAVAKAGTMLKVRLTVSSAQDRNFVAIEDPIPAGFEIVQTSFETEARVHEEGLREEHSWGNPFQHHEFYDDRALFFADYLPNGVHTVTYLVRATGIGTFGHPGAQGEGMYEPEVFGRAASGKLRIE